MSPLHAEQSPDESVHGAGNGNVNVNRFTMAKERTSNVLLACCLVALVVLVFLYRYDAQERDLDRYDDGKRQEQVDKELADLRAQLNVNQALVQAYGLQKSVKGK
jgi:hypothetical protein